MAEGKEEWEGCTMTLKTFTGGACVTSTHVSSGQENHVVKLDISVTGEYNLPQRVPAKK